MRTRSKLTPLGIVVVALLLAGCGTRVKGDTAAGGLDGAPVPSTPAPVAEGAKFGTLDSPCGPNTSGATLTASDTGVTADTITITTISDPGGYKAGLNQGVFDAMQAFGDWCNAQGGINGRELKVELRDAKLFEYKNRVLEACADSFALVGGIGVFDDNGVDDYLNCGLVNIPAATVGVKATEAERTIQPLPSTLDHYNVGSADWVKANYPDAPGAAASLFSNPPLVDFQNKRWVAGYEQKGFKFLSRTAANANESNWGPLVVPLKNDNVKYLTLTSSFEEILPLLKEMNAQSFKPDIFELETNFYDPQFPTLAKDQGIDTGNSVVRLTVYPFEEADTNPAVKTFLDEMAKVDGKLSALSAQAWSAGLLFAMAAKTAGANLTRDSMLAAMKEIHAWDGGGLHGPTDPAAKTSSPCFVVMKVQDGGFTQVYPLADKDKDVYDNSVRRGMACPSDGIATLTNPPKLG